MKTLLNRMLLQKLMVAQIFKTILTFHEVLKFITVLIKVHHYSIF
jgi:hypothetical protein